MVSTCESSLLRQPPVHTGHTHASSWEFFMTLDYELNVIRGQRPHGWSIWVRDVDPLVPPWVELSHWKIYSLSRVATLLAVVLNFVEFNTKTQIDCQVGGPFHVCVIMSES